MDWNDLLYQLSQGIEEKKLSDLKNKLVQEHFNRKAAGIFKIKENLTFETIKYNGTHFQNRIIQTIFEQEQGQLIFELFIFCQKKNITLPPIALSIAVNCALKNKSLAKYIIPILGESGLQIINLFDEYCPLIPSKIKSYFIETNPKDSLAWFGYWVEINEIEAMNWLKESFNKLEEKLRPKFLQQISKLNIENLDGIQFIQEIIGKNKNDISIQCIRLLSMIPDSYLYKELAVEINSIINNQKFTDIESISLFKKFKLKTNKIIELINPDIIEEQNLKSYFTFCEKNNFLIENLTALHKYKCRKSSIHFLGYLTSKDLLVEKYDLGKISESLSHQEVNQFALKWISIKKEDTDIEALLFFLSPMKIYWNDELITEIIALEKHSKIQKLYDMLVFYDQLPFKINPNSKMLSELIEKNIISTNASLNPKHVIQFRKELRLM
jgi:hypothetical protein